MKGKRVAVTGASLQMLESRLLLAATKIMPLGDSVTEGSPGHPSYRYQLWHKLAQAGYEVDFIGSMTGPQSNFDHNHEGHSGWHANQIQANIVNWATQNRPDVVLLHIGTNDLSEGQSASGIIAEIGGIIDNLRTVNPNASVFLAKIIPAASRVAATQALNNLMDGLASEKNSVQSPVVVVDQFTGFDPAADTYDGIHPDDSGELKMANKWYATLSGALPSPPPLPEGTYLSDLTPTSSTNAWGPIEKDRSNGEASANDGTTLTLNGKTYVKGLGVHATSDVTYNLSGGVYSSFRAEIGVDDEVGGAGSVVFRVYANNVLQYTSPTMTGASAAIPLNIPLPAGTTSLRLAVSDAGNGEDFDHADWAMARVVASPPPSAPTITQIQNDTGTSATDGITNDNTIVLSGQADAGNSVTITRVGVGAIGTVTADNSGNWTFNYSAVVLADGSHAFTARATNAFNQQSPVSTAFNVTIDTAAPAVSSGVFEYASRQAVEILFSENVAGSPPASPSGVTLQNLTAGTSVAVSASYTSPAGATFAFPAGRLADGNYRLTLTPGSVSDAAGNSLSSVYVIDFFVLAGDANRDRVVDQADLGVLSTNWNTQSGMTFSHGDFSYDGRVDVADLLLLTNNWQKRLEAPPAPQTSAPVVTSSPATDAAPKTKTRPAPQPRAAGKRV